MIVFRRKLTLSTLISVKLSSKKKICEQVQYILRELFCYIKLYFRAPSKLNEEIKVSSKSRIVSEIVKSDLF